MSFEFLDYDRLSDGVIDLVLEQQEPADPEKGLVPCYHYRIVLHGSEVEVGEIRLRVGTVEAHPALLTAGHIGYEVAEGHRGHGYASRACRLLGPVALAHGLLEVVLTCDPANVASRRTCERLPAVLAGIFDVPPDHPMYLRGRRRVCRYLWTPGGPYRDGVEPLVDLGGRGEAVDVSRAGASERVERAGRAATVSRSRRGRISL